MRRSLHMHFTLTRRNRHLHSRVKHYCIDALLHMHAMHAQSSFTHLHLCFANHYIISLLSSSLTSLQSGYLYSLSRDLGWRHLWRDDLWLDIRDRGTWCESFLRLLRVHSPNRNSSFWTTIADPLQTLSFWLSYLLLYVLCFIKIQWYWVVLLSNRMDRLWFTKIYKTQLLFNYPQLEHINSYLLQTSFEGPRLLSTFFFFFFQIFQWKIFI